MLTLLPRFPVRIDLTPPTAEETQAPMRMPEPAVNGLTRSQIVDRIMTMNPSATAEFLEDFDVEALSEYLDHLTAATLPRGPGARWVRPDNTRGISWSARTA